MTGRFWVKHKRSGLLVMAVVILLSFLFWTEDEISVQRLVERTEAKAGEMAVLTDGFSETSSIQSVDEVCSAVYHASILRQISHRGMIKSIRLYLALIVLAAETAMMVWVAGILIEHFYRIRIVLIHYIHNSDGKK